jgi:hypothetical protein
VLSSEGDIEVADSEVEVQQGPAAPKKLIKAGKGKQKQSAPKESSEALDAGVEVADSNNDELDEGVAPLPKAGRKRSKPIQVACLPPQKTHSIQSQRLGHKPSASLLSLTSSPSTAL